MMLKYKKYVFTSLRAPFKSLKITTVNVERSNLLRGVINFIKRLLRHPCANSPAVPRNDVVFQITSFEQ